MKAALRFQSLLSSYRLYLFLMEHSFQVESIDKILIRSIRTDVVQH